MGLSGYGRNTIGVSHQARVVLFYLKPQIDRTAGTSIQTQTTILDSAEEGSRCGDSHQLGFEVSGSFFITGDSLPTNKREWCQVYPNVG